MFGCNMMIKYKDWDKDKITKYFDVSDLLKHFAKMKKTEEEKPIFSLDKRVEKSMKVNKHISNKRL